MALFTDTPYILLLSSNCNISTIEICCLFFNTPHFHLTLSVSNFLSLFLISLLLYAVMKILFHIVLRSSLKAKKKSHISLGAYYPLCADKILGQELFLVSFSIIIKLWLYLRKLSCQCETKVQ